MNLKTSKADKIEIFQEQDSQYGFPYHHTPSFLSDGSVSRNRILDWGFDYMACLFYVKEYLESLNIISVLEVGCGDGAILGSLSPKISRKVGVDLSEKAISHAKAFFPNIDFYVQDAANMSEKFDAVFAVEVLEHIPDDQIAHFLQSLQDRTNKGGTIYISVPSVNLPLYSKHYRHYSPALLQEQINNAGLDVEVLECRFFRSPVRFEELYKRVTNNRFFSGEIHPLRRLIWNKIVQGLNQANPETAQHVIAILKNK